MCMCVCVWGGGGGLWVGVCMCVLLAVRSPAQQHLHTFAWCCCLSCRELRLGSSLHLHCGRPLCTFQSWQARGAAPLCQQAVSAVMPKSGTDQQLRSRLAKGENREVKKWWDPEKH